MTKSIKELAEDLFTASLISLHDLIKSGNVIEKRELEFYKNTIIGGIHWIEHRNDDDQSS